MITSIHLPAKVVMLATMIALVGLLAQTAAFASTGTAVVVGDGTIEPGLPEDPLADPTPQTVTFGGTAVVATDTAQGTTECDFSGETDESVLSGSGTVTGTCTGPISAGCSIDYSRTAAVITLDGTCGGDVAGPVVGSCQFAVTSFNSYAVVCELVVGV